MSTTATPTKLPRIEAERPTTTLVLTRLTLLAATLLATFVVFVPEYLAIVFPAINFARYLGPNCHAARFLLVGFVVAELMTILINNPDVEYFMGVCWVITYPLLTLTQPNLTGNPEWSHQMGRLTGLFYLTTLIAWWVRARHIPPRRLIHSSPNPSLFAASHVALVDNGNHLPTLRFSYWPSSQPTDAER